jgi:hypothetical protein
MFLLVSGAAFTLFSKQQTSSQIVQGQAGLNLALRNAATQLQIDLANAGSYYYQGGNIPGWPVGVTIVNNVVPSGSSCYNSTTKIYGASCFDKINIIAVADPNDPVNPVPPIYATDSTGGSSPTTNCSNTNVVVSGGKANAYGRVATGLTLAQTAAKFKQNDQLLFLDSSGSFMTSVVLTSDAVVAGSAVKFTFYPTLDQTIASGADAGTYKGYNRTGDTPPRDPLDITTCGGTNPCPPAKQPGKLGEQFCGNDWILKLMPITYQVDTTTDPSNPTLTRKVGNGTAVPVMEQVIGFKVGAAIWNAPTGQPDYNYDANTYVSTDTNDHYNFSLVRAVRVSLIGRTAPSTDPNYKFRNNFDQGPYQVQGTAVVVNPRDLSMND